MIRWLTRKVVKFVLEVLLDSDAFDKLMDRMAEKIGREIPDSSPSSMKVVERAVENRAAPSEDDIDSIKAIAEMVIARGKGVEMSDISGATVVNEVGEDRESVMDMLKNTGD